MKLLFSSSITFFVLAQAQTYPECTAEVARSDDCAAVINANACYNKFRFQNAQTLTCIDGSDDAKKKKQVSMIFDSSGCHQGRKINEMNRCANAVAVLVRSCVTGLRSRSIAEINGLKRTIGTVQKGGGSRFRNMLPER
ncbi:hypothetical protein T440DRAFT_407701 [Plenodomus tracheiphilus IPT5]|uniref:Extracellular membrane protein CFEM domain-containing protein n=1 Tax=Plenodomus tracheiphilus IPT5 TaxID=1408161 RepID=A0A6A7ATG8_9PLEO|nr:hypothetical protein T440DRAFT_407701 [Plenodomus tracheiphilus IPT5]